MYRSVVATTQKNTLTNTSESVVIEFTWDKDGNRIETTSIVHPYLYYEDQNSTSNIKSMFSKPLTKLEFNNTWERSQWIDGNKNVPLFEKLSPQKQYLLDKYCGMEREASFSQFPFRIFYMDIEVEIENTFPNPTNADYPVNVISLCDSLTKIMHVWIYNKKAKDLITNNKQKEINKKVEEYDKTLTIQYHVFNNEVRLFEDFINFWQQNYPDIITGWNIDRFDMLYIINRIIKLFGDEEHYKLSPVNGRVKKPVYGIFEKPQKGISNAEPMVIYRIHGINICDYLNLYKKFEGTSRQSFKLDYIANYELGVGKYDYYEIGYESMKEFMEKDFPTFVLYNIIDTALIKLLDDKLKLIGLMRKVCNIGLCEYESIFQSIPYILGALTIQARKLGVKFLTDSNKSDDKKDVSEGFEGAFVFPTKAGYYKNGVVSLDFNSLYPNTIMTLNLSPDTKIGKIITDKPFESNEIIIRKPSGIKVTISKEKFLELLDKKCTLAPNNVLYMKPNLKFGIIPTFLDGLYKERVSVKKEMKKHIKTLEKIDQAIEQVENKLKQLG